METEHRSVMLDAIAMLEANKDYVSRELLEDLLENKEELIDWIETQQSLIANIGVANYLQASMS
jgi:bacterioferritin